MTELYQHDHQVTLTISQAAEITGFDPKTLSKWASAGQIGAMDLAGATFLCGICVNEICWVTENYPLTIKDGAALANVPFSNLQQWLKQGLIPHAMLPNGRPRLAETDVNYVAWLVARGLTPAAEEPTPYQPLQPHEHSIDIAFHEVQTLLPFTRDMLVRWVSDGLFPGGIDDTGTCYLCSACVVDLSDQLGRHTLDPSRAAKQAGFYRRDRFLRYVKAGRIPALILPNGIILLDPHEIDALRS